MSGERPDGARTAPMLVGRADLLSLALRRWASAVAGTGTLLLVAGEAGIGKTRLLGEFATRVAPEARVLRATAYPRDAEAAGSLLLDLADELTRLGRARQGSALRSRLLEDRAAGSGAGSDRRLLVGDLGALLRDLLDEEPTLLRIEDLHWVDELSLDVLDRLAVSLPGMPAMVVASYRSDELYPRTPLAQWRARLLGQRLAEEVHPPRLGREETAVLAEALTGSLPSTAFLDALQSHSDGIPLHIEELIAAGSPAALPDTVAEAVRTRSALLHAETQSVAAAASVVGRSFPSNCSRRSPKCRRIRSRTRSRSSCSTTSSPAPTRGVRVPPRPHL
ncbi:AAA family ATPase [Naasia aerilata]|uniref:Orc1-like AAA ATPase domain-containing protein n=1 Tax=Naasia aerilata TaxID=1162966 RepID=A0ABN6XSK0_9MICO|nr:AAA family ATPase [Naasia aerilata]BDZ47148.1 hypothetical protein GCM10025866_30570 [Naasia aerilata]